MKQSLPLERVDPPAEAPLFLSAKEAAAELGVSLSTLYAYVSRDLVRSEAVPGSKAKQYRADDIRRLKGERTRRRHGQRRSEGDAEPDVLSFGVPILESEITLITTDAFYYRGAPVLRLAETASLEQTALLLWGVEASQPFTERTLPPQTFEIERLTEDLRPLPAITRALALIAATAYADKSIYNQTLNGRAQTGAILMRLVASAITNRPPSALPIHEQIADAFAPQDRHAADLIRRALVLVADHELNPSTFTVRCVAATGASLYNAVSAGICAAQGPRHGGFGLRVENFLADISHRPDTEYAALERLRDGTELPGFGHPLYPNGDPRATSLLRSLTETHKEAPAVMRSLRIARALKETGGLLPNIDFALGTLVATLNLPRGSSLALFVLGRTAGWIAHALEQYRDGQLIRPRARYVGDVPRGGL